MPRVRLLPRDDDQSGWIQVLPPRPTTQKLAGAQTADCAVIGAGFVGLSIARRLKQLRPDWSVAVVDAQKVGYGASGRSSGFLVDVNDHAGRVARPVRESYAQLARSGIETLRSLVATHNIDCAWDETGWIRACAGKQGRAALDRTCKVYDELGCRYERLDHEGMFEVTGSRFYRSGVRLPGYPLVQTAALVRGLADSLPEGTEIYEESPVVGLEPGPPHVLTTPNGSIQADRLFLATNGYTPFLGYERNRILPLLTFASMTRVLTAAEQAELGGEREWGVLSADPMGSSVRRTRDQRLLIRNTALHSGKLEVSEQRKRWILENHRTAFESRFPGLRDLEFDYTWGGLLGTSANGQMSFGERARQLYIVAAFTATGIAVGTAAGCAIVDLSLGEDSKELCDAKALPKPTWLPPNPFRSIGGGIVTALMNRQAGAYL